jgi:uncharacterized lipoprotein YajG
MLSKAGSVGHRRRSYGWLRQYASCEQQLFLTNFGPAAKPPGMTRIPLLRALAATAALAGCKKENHTIIAGPDGDAANQAPPTNGPVVLPPSIASSKIYRCKDNSVVYIDWLSDNKSANFRANQTDVPVTLATAEAGKPMTAQGYSLTGTPEGGTITLERPGKGSQSCKA